MLWCVYVSICSLRLEVYQSGNLRSKRCNFGLPFASGPGAGAHSVTRWRLMNRCTKRPLWIAGGCALTSSHPQHNQHGTSKKNNKKTIFLYFRKKYIKWIFVNNSSCVDFFLMIFITVEFCDFNIYHLFFFFLNIYHLFFFLDAVISIIILGLSIAIINCLIQTDHFKCWHADNKGQRSGQFKIAANSTFPQNFH